MNNDGGADFNTQIKQAQQMMLMQLQTKQLEEMASKCFARCVPKPSSELTDSERKCTA